MNTIRFDELDLNPQILRGIADMGFEEATPIQSQAIPVVLSGVDAVSYTHLDVYKRQVYNWNPVFPSESEFYPASDSCRYNLHFVEWNTSYDRSR